MPVLLNGLSEFRSHGKLADLLAPPSPSTIRSISPLARVIQGEYDVPTFIVHGTEDEVAPFAAAKRFVDVQRLRNPAIACEFLAVPGAKHLFDLGLKDGSRDWDRLVAPGYQFLSKMLGGQ